MDIQSILWIFYTFYLSVVSLAGQYFVYFYRICYYFCVARELQTREVLLDVCDDLRARSSLNAAPRWGGFLAVLHITCHCHSALLNVCSYIW
jgi:hypothetical protein